MITFVALGGTDEIGASCHFLHVAGSGIVLDAGLDPEEDGPPAVPRFDVIHGEADWYVDHAIITHAHHDHMGGLPVLIQHFPHVMAHMTPTTGDLVEYLLPASARLQRRRMEEGTSAHAPLYDEEELDVYNHLYLTHELGAPFDVTGLRGATPVQAAFYDAGHILGSAGVLLTFEEDGHTRRIFYTGDTNTERQTILPGGQYPEPPLDVLILESTAGADEEAVETTRRAEERALAEALQQVLGRGGTALVPVFAMGRAQEVLALIGDFKQDGRIDPDVPVYTAGSLLGIADLYDKTRRRTPRRDPEFTVFGVEQGRLPRRRKRIAKSLEGPAIHVVSSGMMFEPTLSNRLARRLVEDEKNGVLFVGYAKDDSPAQRLQDAAARRNGTGETSSAEVVLNPERGAQPVRCQVERFRLSGHSHREQLVGLVGRMQPQHVVLVHGATEARAWMADEIAAAYPEVAVHRPEQGRALQL